jgi:ABC-type sugar transport system permease subunit
VRAAVSPPRPARGRLPARIRRNVWSYVYVLPFCVLTATFVLYPIGASIGYTVFRWDGIGEPTAFVGADNFVRVVEDPIFWTSVRNSVVYTLVLVPLQLLLALVLALILNERGLRGATFFRSVFFLPAVMSPAIIGVIFQLLITQGGRGISDLLGAKGGLLADPRTALATVIAIGIWNTLGYNLVYFLAGLQTIPDELYEAARIDGASQRHLFRHITIPGLRAIGAIIIFLAVIGSLQVFDLVQVLTGGGPYFATSVVNTYIYAKAFGGAVSGGAPTVPDVGLASAASLLYGVLLMLLAVGQALVLARARKRAGAQVAS